MDHHHYLSEALALAQIRKGFTSPNPAVGAVLVKDHQIIATGHHEGPGFPHAEVMACSNISTNLDDATLYVTLEPCSHWGRTPPCTDLIINQGIKTVYFAYEDPNPEVAGRGQKLLQQHGIHCERIEHEAINLFYRSYQHWLTTRTPWVVSKLAMSMDAKIADELSLPVKITGQAAQEYTHQGRRRADAILTTVKTIIKDDPNLNVRQQDLVIAKHLYVIDSRLELPLKAQVFKTAKALTVFHSSADEHKIHLLAELGVKCQRVSSVSGHLNLHEILQYIGSQGVQELWVEAGGKLFGSLARQNLSQQSFIYLAPKLLGSKAVNAFHENEDIFDQAKSVGWFNLGQDSVCEIIW